jgi:uncharacterized protein (DUF2267 family)
MVAATISTESRAARFARFTLASIRRWIGTSNTARTSAQVKAGRKGRARRVQR